MKASILEQKQAQIYRKMSATKKLKIADGMFKLAKILSNLDKKKATKRKPND